MNALERFKLFVISTLFLSCVDVFADLFFNLVFIL